MANAAWVIQKPSRGRYTVDVLKLEDRPLGPAGPGEVVVRPLMLSLDPSNLMWLKLQPGWMEDVKVGDVMKGPGVAIVEQSASTGIAPGDLVYAPFEWRARSIIAARQLTAVPSKAARPLSANLTIFSHIGRAAMIGLHWVARIRRGETVLVSGAHGATGALACEIALAEGCRVIGVAGGPAKVDWLRRTLGIEAIDYKSKDVGETVARLCPDGPDVFFDNVGGPMLDAVLPRMAIRGRIAICGQISQYDHETPDAAYRVRNLLALFMRRLRMEGFVVPDFAADFAEIDARLTALYATGKLTDRPHFLDGLEQAAHGLEMLVEGRNEGKLIVRMAQAD